MYAGKSSAISKSIATKTAGSGLLIKHLVCVCKRGGKEGLKEMLRDRRSGRVRVTNRKNILTNICDFVSKICSSIST